MYISLDLETTGFEADKDQIIEIAAIRFEGDTIVDRFETLINPEIPIPAIITHITGIKAADLTDSPKLPEVQSKLMEFLGNYPIVGHNINFDITFLKQKGLPIQNPLYDTLQLASILLPDLPSYSLDTLTRLLKIEHKNKHRAMSDTEACFQLFLILEAKINGIDPKTWKEIEKVLGKSSWELKELFAEKSPKQSADSSDLGLGNYARADLLQSEAAPQPGTEIQDSKFQIPDSDHIVLDENFIANFYQPKGLFATSQVDYEARPSQQKMSEKIWEAFSQNHHLLVEAGTGTGKTIAYLLSGIMWSLKHGEKIVVSTYTHNLQKQILEKDIPLLHRALPEFNFQSTILKGRRNYLSLQRLARFQDKNVFLDHEVTFLIKILLWLKRTETGDLDELSLQGKEFALLDEICCAEQMCDHSESRKDDGSCYLLKARQKAKSADIIIVNHALLMQNLDAPTPIIPEFNYLVIDEAHHLEKVATDSLTINLSVTPFQKPFIKLARILEHLERQQLLEPQTLAKASTAKKHNDHLITRLEIFFGLIGIYLEKNINPHNYQFHFHLKEADFQSGEWQKIHAAGQATLEMATDILNQIRDVQKNSVTSSSAPATLFDFDDTPKDSREGAGRPVQIFQELEGIMDDCQKKLDDLKKVFSNENRQNWVTWIFKSIEESISLKSAPLDIGEHVQALLFNQKKSVILTSATLKTDHTFNFIKDQLGFNKTIQEVTLPSHFMYPDQVKILIPDDLSEPMTEGYFLGCAKLISEIIKKNHGRALALFTSKKSLAATYHLIAPPLKEEGFTVLAQQITGGRGKILEHFKDEPENCAIFGLNSFWEGVDIKGSDLTCVIIQKLPFDPPDDPLILARSQRYRDGFNEYILPRAILRFKQGFGRLIRSSKDTGAIVILDSRIIQKTYGHEFLESLPPGIKIDYAPKENLAELL